MTSIASHSFAAKKHLFFLLSILFAVLGTVHILVRTSTLGAALTADGVLYVSIAANLIAGDGLQDFRGEKLLPSPPLFPFILAALGLFEVEPMGASRFVNAVAFGLTILLSGLWLHRTLRSPFLAAGSLLVITTSYPLNHMASHILTEPTFVLLVLLALLWMDSFKNRSLAWRSLVLASVFASLASVTRYAGVTAILTGVTLLLLRRRTSFPATLKYAAAYGAMSSIPLGAVLGHNWILFGLPSRDISKPGQPLSDTLSEMLSLFEEGMIPTHVPDWTAYLLWTVAGLVILAGAGVCVHPRNQRVIKTFLNLGVADTETTRVSSHQVKPSGSGNQQLKTRLSTLPIAPAPILPFAVFILVYLTFMVTITHQYIGKDINARYVMPIYVPLLFIGAFLLDRFLCFRTDGWLSVARWVASALMLIGCLTNLGLSIKKNAALTIQAMESGFHGKAYNTAYWDNHETIEYLKANPTATRIYANHFGLLHARLALKKGHHVIGKYLTLPGEMGRLVRKLNGAEEAHIVWFLDAPVVTSLGAGYNAPDVSVSNLRTIPGIETIAEMSDGIIFRVPRCYGGETQETNVSVSAGTFLTSGDSSICRSGPDVADSSSRGRWKTMDTQPTSNHVQNGTRKAGGYVRRIGRED